MSILNSLKEGREEMGEEEKEEEGEEEDEEKEDEEKEKEDKEEEDESSGGLVRLQVIMAAHLWFSHLSRPSLLFLLSYMCDRHCLICNGKAQVYQEEAEGGGERGGVGGGGR